MTTSRDRIGRRERMAGAGLLGLSAELARSAGTLSGFSLKSPVDHWSQCHKAPPSTIWFAF